MFERFVKAVVKGIADGLKESASSSRIKGMMDGIDDKAGIGGHFGTAKMGSCGVCGMGIPRDAQVCPYCQRQPTCQNTGRGNRD